MIKNKSGSFVYFKYKNLSRQKNIIHFVSTKIGGISKEPYQDTNMSFMVGDNPGLVVQNRTNFFKELNIPLSSCVFAGLTHGDRIKIVDKIPTRLVNGFSTINNYDGLITKNKNICLAVTAADCLPITFYDKKKKVIAMVHSGWRGSVKNISGKMVLEMKKNFDSNPEDLQVGIGPSICGKHYEVDAAVVDKISKEFIYSDILEKKSNDKWNLDLVKLNIHQLVSEGVLARNIETSGYCTYEDNGLFYSNRRTSPTGRFMSGIILKDE